MPRKIKMSEFGSPTPAEPRQESVPGPALTQREVNRAKLEEANARMRKIRADIAKKRAAKAQEEDAERLADLRELQKLSGFKDKKTPEQIRNEQIDKMLADDKAIKNRARLGLIMKKIRAAKAAKAAEAINVPEVASLPGAEANATTGAENDAAAAREKAAAAEAWEAVAEKIHQLVKNRTKVWIKRSNGDWQEATPYDSGYGNSITKVKWYDDKQKRQLYKSVDSLDLLRWQDEDHGVVQDKAAEAINVQQVASPPGAEANATTGAAKDAAAEAVIDAAVEAPAKFHESSTVNGIQISVGWDEMYRDYTIYFPQIEIGEEASERGVHDQIIRLTRLPKVAKQVYEKAVELAKTTTDAYELYKKINEFSIDLPYNEAQEEDAERLADLRELQKLSGFKDKKTPEQIRNEQIDEVLEEERTADLRQLAQSSVAAREKAAAAKAAEEDREWDRKIAETRTRIAKEEAAAVPSESAEDEEWVKTLKAEIERGVKINEEAAKAKESAGQKIAKKEQKKIASAESDPYLREEAKKLKKLQAEQTAISDRLESLTGMTPDEAYEKLVLNAGFMGRIKRGLASMANIPTYKLLDEWLALSRQTEESQRLINGVKPDLIQQRRGRYLRAKAEGPSEESTVKAALDREAAREYAEEHGPLTEESLGLDQVNVQEQQSSEALPEMISEEDQEIERIQADYKKGIVRDENDQVLTDERAIRRARPAGLVNVGGRAGTRTSFGEVGGRRGLTTRGSEQTPAVTEEAWQAQLEANRQAYEASQREIASQKRITEEEKPSTPELTKQEFLAIQRLDQMFKGMQALQAEIEAATDEQALESQSSFNERMALFDQGIETLIEKNNNSTSEELFESAKRADEELKKLKSAHQKKYAALQQSARSAGKGQRRTGITLSSGRTSGGRSFGASAMDQRATISTRPEQPSVTEAEWQTELAKNQQEYEASKQEDRLAYQRQNANEIASIRTEYPQAAEEWNKINTKLQELDQEDRDELSSIFGTSDIATAYTLNLARKDLKGDKNAESLINKANTLLEINNPNESIVIDPKYLKEVRKRNKTNTGNKSNKAA